jgi:hypothetical protein
MVAVVHHQDLVLEAEVALEVEDHHQAEEGKLDINNIYLCFL